MKRILLFLVAGVMSATIARGAGINYNGTSLQENTEFTRTQCGTAFKDVMKEISGLACSRTTPGYLWAHGDENTSGNKKIIAINPNAQSKNDELVMTVNISGDPGRDDWEDIATGVYGNKNYVFVGAIGDNDLQFNDSYYIYYFEEPAITSGTQTVTVNYIRFGYPDNKAHNTETLMYDNVEQMFYIVDKVKSGICHLYKLPFSTTYGTGVQRLTEVCALGNGSKFNYCTGGDITPDGQWMAIKSKPYVLLWERQGSESLSQTAQRNPVQVMAYQEEEQGESLAWFNDSIFYTTSDSKSNTPIYKYVRAGESGSDTTSVDPTPVTVDSTLKAIHEVVLTNGYYAYINADETIIRGWYLAGEDVPTVSSYKVSDGATLTQNGNTVTVTALDKSTATYTMDIQAVTPVEFTANEIVFDGSESSWVKGAYGFDATKKWRFSKTDEDYSREIAGKTHVELFLPACDTIVLKSMASKEREINVYINGEKLGGKTKLLIVGSTFAVLQSAPFMLTIASAQSSGDGGVAAIRMARKAATGIEATKSEVRCVKMLRDGQLLIKQGDAIYTIQGQRIQ